MASAQVHPRPGPNLTGGRARKPPHRRVLHRWANVLGAGDRRDASLTRLKWFATITPLAFLAAMHYLLHTVLELFHDFPSVLILLPFVAAGIAVFSFGVFQLIGRLEQEIVRQNKQLTSVNEIAALSAMNPHVDELLNVTLDKVLSDMRADAGLIHVLDADTDEPIALRVQGFSEELAHGIITNWVEPSEEELKLIRSQNRPVVEDLFRNPGVFDNSRREDFRYGLGVTLSAERQARALLGVARRSEQEFTEPELELLSGIGSQLGLALRNAVLFARAGQRNQELAALVAVGRAATASISLPEVLDAALDAALEVTSGEVAEIWLADAGSLELTLARQRGCCVEAFQERARFAPGEGIPGLAAESGSAIVVHDLATNPRFLRERVRELGFQTYAAIPLSHRSETVGVLAVAARDRAALSSSAERRLLDGIAEQLAIAIENSRLHERVLDTAVLEERERISRELHDGLAQVLGYINTQTLAIRKLLVSERTDEAMQQLSAMEAAAKTVYMDVREAILGLRVSLTPSDGFIPSLRGYLQDYGEMTGVSLELGVSEEATEVILPGSAELQLMRIIQEALNNVRKHAKASVVTVSLSREQDALRVEIADDGRGFMVDRLSRTGRPRFGLQTMRERAEAIGGDFTIETTAEEGTSVVVHVPIEQPAEVRDASPVSG